MSFKIERKPKFDQDMSAMAASSGAIQNPYQQNQMNYNSTNSNNQGNDPFQGSTNLNNSTTAKNVPASSGRGQGAGMINVTSNGTYGVGKGTGTENQSANDSSTAYKRQGLNPISFKSGVSQTDNPEMKMKKLNVTI